MTAPSDAQDRDIRAISVNFNETRREVEVHFANGLQMSYDLLAYHNAIANGTINVDTADITFDGKPLDEHELSSDLYPDNSSQNVQIDPVVVNSVARASAWSQLVDSLPLLLVIIGVVVLIALGH